MGVMFVVKQTSSVTVPSYIYQLWIKAKLLVAFIIFSDKVSTNSISNLIGTNNIAQHNTKLLWLLCS